ncbi:TPA: hypothetical protein U5E40_002527 [Yersinia enterocolitica]|nr:hypothetical protein [Yersinia enterocolitica]
MSDLLFLIDNIDFNAMFLILSAFALLASSTYIGSFFCSERLGEIGDETKVIITTALSLLGLLLLFTLLIYISEYNSRQQSQVMDGMSIANTYQHSDLLNTNNKNKTKVVWDEYLDGRI